MWIVDSSVWIDYFNGTRTQQSEILDRSLGQRDIAIGDIILMEVLQGFRSPRQYILAREAMLNLHIYTMGGWSMSLRSVENYRWLRRRGITVRKNVDCLIATFVIEHGFALLHDDRDFTPFERYFGLKVVRS